MNNLSNLPTKENLQNGRNLKLPKNKSILILLASIIFIIGLSLGSIYMMNKKSDEYIYEGISVNNIYIGGLSKENGIIKLEKELNEPIKNKELLLSFYNTKTPFNLKDIEASYSVNDIVEEAFQYKKNANMFVKFVNKINLRKYPVNITKDFSYDKEKLNAFLENLSKSLNKAPKDATIYIKSNGEFNIEKDQEGVSIKTDELKDLIIKAMFSNETTEIEISNEILPAKIKYEDLTKIQDKIGSYTTNLTNDYNRTNNIIISAKYLNKTLVMPGEIFSMNKALGPRTVEKGYTDAPIFINNKVVPDLAGGICQLVSTAYNVVLLTDLEIVERSPHSLPVNYVPPGRDAAIAGDYMDLKFKNNKDYPIYIESYVNNKNLVVNFYGKKEDNGETVEITSQGSTVNGKPYAEVYKNYYKNGKLLNTKCISKNSYN